MTENQIDTKSILPKDSEKPCADIRLVGRAIREGWPITKEMRPGLVKRLIEISEKTSVPVPDAEGQTRAREDVADAHAIAAARVLAAMDQISQDDYQYEDKNQRLDEGKATERLSMEQVVLRKAIARPAGQ